MAQKSLDGRSLIAKNLLMVKENQPRSSSVAGFLITYPQFRINVEKPGNRQHHIAKLPSDSLNFVAAGPHRQNLPVQLD